jgi:hypothetical protein
MRLDVDPHRGRAASRVAVKNRFDFVAVRVRHEGCVMQAWHQS